MAHICSKSFIIFHIFFSLNFLPCEELIKLLSWLSMVTSHDYYIIFFFFLLGISILSYNFSIPFMISLLSFNNSLIFLIFLLANVKILISIIILNSFLFSPFIFSGCFLQIIGFSYFNLLKYFLAAAYFSSSFFASLDKPFTV